MKKIVTMVIMMAVLLVSIPVVEGAGKGYRLSQIRPNIFQVVATESDHLGGSANLSGIYLFTGYGESLSDALQYIGEKYTIKSITPIVYGERSGSQFGSATTKMLIVIVESFDTSNTPKPKR